MIEGISEVSQDIRQSLTIVSLVILYNSEDYVITWRITCSRLPAAEPYDLPAAEAVYVCEWLKVVFFCFRCIPLSSDRQHLSCDVCLEVRGEIIRTVLCCIVY